MTFETLIGPDMKKLIQNIRVENDTYEELVLFNQMSSELHLALNQKLGTRITSENSSNHPLDKDIVETAIEIANSNGGIDDDQYLYSGVYKDSKLVIMIWPWQDNEHITVKKFLV